MQAIVARAFGGPEVLELAEVPLPQPGPGELRVRVRAAGVNPVDGYIRSVTYARRPELPYTPGFDFAGVVEALGVGAARFALGARVYGHGVVTGHGAYAEATLARETDVELLAERASFAQGAALGIPYATAWKALFLLGAARAGETVLVHGASGGVGVAAVQLARARGLRVLGTAGTPRGLELARAQGAHEVFDHRASGYAEAILAATGGRGVELVIEMLANVNLERDLELLARGGRVVIVGSRGRVELDPRKIMAREAAVTGLVLFDVTAAELREIHAGLAAGLESGWLAPVIGRELPLAAAARAHVALLEPGAYGKIVLVP